MRTQCTLVLVALSTLGLAREVSAQSSLVCPQTSADSTFTGTTMQSECSSTVTTGCTTKSGVSYNGTGLTIPGTAGSFQSPPGSAVDENVLFAATADFDQDGWEDLAAANDYDKIFVMRNQTITCGTTGCSGSTTVAPSVQTISSTWWNTATNKRESAFRFATTATGTQRPLKAAPSGASLPWTPMVAADFNGDGWPDFAALSFTYSEGGGFPQTKYATAARLYLNTQNCRKTTAPTVPCGIGMLCTGQATNGACGSTGYTTGAWSESNLSCTTTSKCPNYHPTFATYDLRTGAAVSANNSFTTYSTTPTATTFKPGDFGPMSRPTTNMQVLDWDGDGDLDILFGHGASGSATAQKCPSALCTVANKQFYVGIDVWLNNCSTASTWNPTTKSCPGHIPSFSRSEGTCTGAACDNADTLFPSTAHNSTAITPSTNANFDYVDHQVPVFAYTDIDNDNDRDLVLGSIGCCNTSSNSQYKLRIFKNTSGTPYTHTLDTGNPISLGTSNGTYPGFEGALTAVFVHDFSGDGYPDIITGTDAVSYSGSIGGRTRYWRNSGDPNNPFGTNWPSCLAAGSRPSCTGCSATCNPSPTQILSNSCGSSSCTPNTSASPPTFADFDNGMIINYDNDPQGTKDVVFTNGAPVGSANQEFYVFPNRISGGGVAACGSAISGTLPAPAGDATVTGACVTPSASFSDSTSSVRYYISNENPANYLLACTQTQSGYSPSPCCVSFTNITGHTLTWKAELDSNSSDDGSANKCSTAGTSSPRLDSVVASYTFNEAEQHYRAGVVVSDGIAYVGSFRQPGNRGHFYGLATGDGSKYYDASEKIDAQTSRNIYTADNVGAGLSAIAFNPSSPSTTLVARVGASSPSEATDIITWALSERFGVTDTSRLGAITGSTPAILTPPFRPNWYTYLDSSDKSLYDTFSTANATRVPLALFGSMDGMVHAIISVATDISNSANGTEAWAFVPPYVAAAMKADYTASCAPTCSPLTTTVTAYPDGSPTLVDFKKSDDTIATVALIGDGAGGGSLTALDVTNTVSSSFSVTAPDPLWSVKPGDADAGKATAKPAVARVRLTTTSAETFVAIAGTGLNSSDPSKGKVIAGYNLETGAPLWKFEMECPLTSDISVFETDDETEPGDPEIDGFMDRAVFADNCGNVYKIPVNVDLSGGWLGNEFYGSIALDDSNGVKRRVLFSTTQSGALGTGEQRPIVGTIGARSDANTDMVLFFGTGGLESYDVTKTNEFYAVRAKDGTIRNKLTGTCDAGGHCEKFYGGVVITTDAVIIQRSTDAAVSSTSCDYGSSVVQFLDLTTFAQTLLIDQVGGAPIAASAGPLFGDAGALYFATVSGEIKRIGQPRATSAGQDSAGGTMQNSTTGGSGSSGDYAFTLMGWRVVL